MAAGKDFSLPPQPFARVVEDIAQHVWRPEIEVEEIPGPKRIAPFSVAITADVVRDDVELGNGRLVVLHDPAGNESWEGTFRCVSYSRAEIEPEMATDPLLTNVGWAWLTDALTMRGADLVAPSGTVTAVSSQSFGAMADEPPTAEIEIRASWTPLLNNGLGMDEHLSAWDDLLCLLAGLPPLSEGIVMMPKRGGGRRLH